MNHYSDAITILQKTLSIDESPWTEPEKLLFEIARKNPKALVDAYGRLFDTTAKTTDKLILEYAKNSKGKIDTIKYCRKITGEGLKEAKEHVERLLTHDFWDEKYRMNTVEESHGE